jgi:hypothetical protein
VIVGQLALSHAPDPATCPTCGGTGKLTDASGSEPPIKTMTESEIQNAILLRYGREPDLTLWRQNTGVAQEQPWKREHLERLVGMLRVGRLAEALSLLVSLLREKPRFTRYGLAVGSADIVGIVGPRGTFLALEVKTPTGRVSKEQQQWLDIVNRRGGVARVVRSVEEAGAAIDVGRRL